MTKEHWEQQARSQKPWFLQLGLPLTCLCWASKNTHAGSDGEEEVDGKCHGC